MSGGAPTKIIGTNRKVVTTKEENDEVMLNIKGSVVDFQNLMACISNIEDQLELINKHLAIINEVELNKGD